MLHKYKKYLNENPLLLVAGQAASTGSAIAKKSKEHYDAHKHEYRVQITDIIKGTNSKFKQLKKNCSDIENNIYYYMCRADLKKKKIKEFERAKRFCRFNEDTKLCTLRITEYITKLKVQLLKYERKINSLKTYELKLKNARKPPNFSIGSEYKTWDEILGK